MYIVSEKGWSGNQVLARTLKVNSANLDPLYFKQWCQLYLVDQTSKLTKFTQNEFSQE